MKCFISVLIAAAVAAICLVGCVNDDDNSPAPPAAERLYVVQSSDESLGEINLTSGEVTAHVLDLGLYCNDIVKFGSRLYVVNSGTNTIQEIDAETNQTLRVMPIDSGINPWTVAFLNIDTMAVSCFVSRNVLILEVESGAVIGNLPMPTAPEGMVVHEDKIYVCETGVDWPIYSAGHVRVYDTESWELLDSIEVGVNAQFAAVDPVGRLHVVCTGDYTNIPGSIHVINLQTREVVQVLDVGGTPNTVSFGGGFAYVSAGGFGGPGFVFRYQMYDLTLLNDWTNPIVTGGGATDLEAVEDGSYFVSCFETDEVWHHNPDGTLIHTYLMSDGPGYMVHFP